MVKIFPLDKLDFKGLAGCKQGNIIPDTLLALFPAANQQIEEESEIMMNDFLSSGGSVEDFLEQYHDKRKLAHMRRIKVEN